MALCFDAEPGSNKTYLGNTRTGKCSVFIEVGEARIRTVVVSGIAKRSNVGINGATLDLIYQTYGSHARICSSSKGGIGLSINAKGVFAGCGIACKSVQWQQQ